MSIDKFSVSKFLTLNCMENLESISLMYLIRSNLLVVSPFLGSGRQELG